MAGLLAAPATAAPAAQVTVVVSDSTAPYLEASLAVARDLGGLATVVTVSPEQLGRPQRHDGAAIVTLGTRALKSALAAEPKASVIAALIPRSAYEAALGSQPRPQSGRRTTTAVFLDQPFARQLNLVKTLVPDRRRVGVLASPAADDMVRRVASAARGRGLLIVKQTLAKPDDISYALERLLGESEVLLALPDPTVFNSHTVYNILLSALRARQPVIGFSDAYVRAGAVAAVYSTPQQLGRQAGGIAADLLGGAALPVPQYPRTFSVSVNSAVARALGLQIQAPEEIAAALRRMEATP
jgi:putative ABC transport system substrate-binding protein